MEILQVQASCILPLLLLTHMLANLHLSLLFDFVVFPSIAQRLMWLNSSMVDFALQKNRQNMGRRYVEVFRSKRQEYYKAIANEVADARGGSPRRNAPRAKSSDEAKESAEHTGILRLRGLPFSAGKDDVMEFFKDFVLSEDAVHIVLNSEGRPSGEAFVEFTNAEDSKAAMSKDRMTLGSRYIELFPSFSEEMEEAISRGR
ncbi:hypothetical protein V6Z11_D09G133500 [Gossypium hirsutum]